MANITQALLNDSTATIVAAEALGYLKANTVLAQIVNKDYKHEVAVHGSAVDIPFRGALSVNSKAANTAVTLQVPADTKATVTLDTHEEVSFLIEDIADALSRPNALVGYMEDAMKVMAEKVDADIAALYSGFSQTIDATAGLGEDDFREARRLLNSAKAPLTDRWAVLHEDAEYELLAIERFVNSDYGGSLDAGASGLINAYSGRFLGFNVLTDQKITISGSQAKNMFMHKNAITMVSRPLPIAPTSLGVLQKTMEEDGVSLRVTLTYNPDHLGIQFTVDMLYGLVELRDSHGVAVSTTEI